MSSQSVRLGISACLLGEAVRYDGKHKRQYFIAEMLARYFDFVPLCPELAIGLGVPRAPIQLVGEADHPRAIGVDDKHRDVTDPLQAYAGDVIQEHADIAGYIFKSRSPSCGISDTPVVNDQYEPVALGSGVFARAICESLPLMPVIDEVHILEPGAFECFIRKVSVWQRWRELQRSDLSIDSLRGFHERHRLLAKVHSPGFPQDLKNFSAGVEPGSLDVVAKEYIRLLLKALDRPSSIASHTSVLLDIFETLKKFLGAQVRNDLSIAIADYGCGTLPWQVPIEKIRAAMSSCDEPGFIDDVYLHPHPALDLLQQGAIFYDAGQ